MTGTFILVSAACFSIGGIQLTRALNATSMNSEYKSLFPYENVYDTCIIGLDLKGQDSQSYDPFDI